MIADHLLIVVDFDPQSAQGGSRCDAPLTVLSSRFRLLPSENDFPVSAVFAQGRSDSLPGVVSWSADGGGRDSVHCVRGGRVHVHVP